MCCPVRARRVVRPVDPGYPDRARDRQRDGGPGQRAGDTGCLSQQQTAKRHEYVHRQPRGGGSHGRPGCASVQRYVGGFQGEIILFKCLRLLCYRQFYIYRALYCIFYLSVSLFIYFTSLSFIPLSFYRRFYIYQLVYIFMFYVCLVDFLFNMFATIYLKDRSNEEKARC